MTTEELNNEFDIHYNSIAGQSAPGLDAYEKSVFLTKAQLEIVKNYYDSLSNRKKKGFESTEKRRVDLKELIKDFKTSSFILNDFGIDAFSKFIEIPNDLFLIINEVLYVDIDNCGTTQLNVIPITHDEYNLQNNNPFQRPDKSKAWRLDLSKISNKPVVEIITPYKIKKYNVRYLKFPKPIILKDLDTLFPGENLTIDGYNLKSTSELHQSIHREILDRAVELALRDYKPQNLESKVQLDVRNE